jgi:hypothetical protein
MLSSFAVCATCGLVVPDTIMHGRHHCISASREADSCKSEHTQMVVFCCTNTGELQNQLALLTCSEKDWKVDSATMASLA